MSVFRTFDCRSRCCRRSRLGWVTALAIGVATAWGGLNGPSKPMDHSPSGKTEIATRAESRPRFQDPDPRETSPKFDPQANLAAFDQVWETIKKTHWDPDKVGADWDLAKDRFRPKVEAAETAAEVRSILEELVGELGQSHFGIIPADAYEVVEGDTQGQGKTGIEFRLADDAIVVTGVRSGSPAEAAGIQPGWILTRVQQRPATTLIEKFQNAAHGPVRVETVCGLAMERIASGTPGEAIELELLDNDDQPQTRTLNLVADPGKEFKFGNLPAMHVIVDSKTLEGGIGYFRFNMFFDPANVMGSFRKVVTDPQHQNGLVVDLRGNRGGIAGMTMGMARPFVSEQTKLGTMTTRDATLKFAVFPAAERYPGPVAILIDECSVSSAEIFAGGLADIGAATVLGRRSAGLALPSVVVKLPNGDGFQYAFANYVSESGRSLERDGVVPKVSIPIDRKQLASEPDPVLAAALAWIHAAQTTATDN